MDTNRLLVSAFCLLLSICAAEPLSGGVGGSFTYDRLDLVARWLNFFYPDLGQGPMMLRVDATLYPASEATVRSLKVYPCRPEGSIGPSVVTLPAVNSGLPEASQPSVKPLCGAEPTPDFSDFMAIYLDLSKDLKYPISKLQASGKFVDGRLAEVRNQFKDRRYATEAEGLETLGKGKPQYGPESKKEFVSKLDVGLFEKMTGCRLQPKTATFVTGLDAALIPELQWHVQGEIPSTHNGMERKCYASFEPFDAHLTLFTRQ
jgi:hypothetical protein